MIEMQCYCHFRSVIETDRQYIILRQLSNVESYVCIHCSKIPGALCTDVFNFHSAIPCFANIRVLHLLTCLDLIINCGSVSMEQIIDISSPKGKNDLSNHGNNSGLFHPYKGGNTTR